MNLRWSFGLVLGFSEINVLPCSVGRTGKNSSHALDVWPFIVCLAVVQYEQVDVLGKQSDQPLNRTMQHGESGETFQEGV